MASPGQDSQRRSVNSVELFFDLVYVFAVTQLSHHLLTHSDLTGALGTLLLLAVVWWPWVYTTWATAWLDAGRLSVRLLLIGLMLVSLVMAAALPEAFERRGLVVAVAYVVMQVGRSLFVAIAGRGWRLGPIFVRIVLWSLASGCLWIAGGLTDGRTRVVLWVVAFCVDLVGGTTGFYVPRMGRTYSNEWAIEGALFAERCQQFIIIVLGESIVVTGGTLADLHPVHGIEVGAFVVAFAGSAALWWIYFDRGASESAREIDRSDDPGRLALWGYHLVHPIMVAGIIVTAAADQRVLSDPTEVGNAEASWLILGGAGLFLVGHALFKAVVWSVVSWQRVGAVAVLALLGLVAGSVTALTLAYCAVAVIIGVAALDRVVTPPTQVAHSRAS